jgi:hypothetical protein
MTPKELFLSHASADHKFTAALVRVLRKSGIPVWYSETHLVGARQWHDEIGAALKRCDWFAVVLSPHSLTSMWVKRELNYALRQRRFEERIVPILHKRCDAEQLSWTLGAVQRVDFTRSFQRGCRDLLRIWGMDARKP